MGERPLTYFFKPQFKNKDRNKQNAFKRPSSAKRPRLGDSIDIIDLTALDSDQEKSVPDSSAELIDLTADSSPTSVLGRDKIPSINHAHSPSRVRFQQSTSRASASTSVPTTPPSSFRERHSIQPVLGTPIPRNMEVQPRSSTLHFLHPSPRTVNEARESLGGPNDGEREYDLFSNRDDVVAKSANGVSSRSIQSACFFDSPPRKFAPSKELFRSQETRIFGLAHTSRIPALSASRANSSVPLI
jgi:hypothetical protein